jgi:acyl-CoA synthetase (AMP-forming)/AMP-acid ligase II
LSSLKKLFFAGAPVTPIVFQKAIEKFGNVFLHLFGTSETVGQATVLRIEDVTRALAEGKTEILSSCGRSFADMQSQVVDENDNPVSPGEIGEIRVRGLGTTLGYWNKDEQTREVFRNGWYYPMDLCKVDEQGYIYVVDRKKDMIITGGENVYPAEVENVLYKHPAVAQVAVKVGRSGYGPDHEKKGFGRHGRGYPVFLQERDCRIQGTQKSRLRGLPAHERKRQDAEIQASGAVLA